MITIEHIVKSFHVLTGTALVFLCCAFEVLHAGTFSIWLTKGIRVYFWYGHSLSVIFFT
jgi:hypothetical protein